MAKQKNSKQKRGQDRQEDLVQVDAYLIPANQAEMYQTLREAVAQEALDYWREKYPSVDRLPDLEEGEAIVVYGEDQSVLFCFYLNPQNISQAQKARDKDQLAKFLVKFEPDDE